MVRMRIGQFNYWAGSLLWAGLLLGLVPLGSAQTPEAERSFTTAARLFHGGWYDQAEKAFGAFVTSFPTSTNRDHAVLLQAQSRYELKDYPGVVRLLQSRVLTNAPPIDQNLYWLAQAQSQLEQFDAAAETFGALLKCCPSSELRLEASYGEALARFKLGDTASTVELLGQTNGAFQVVASRSTNHPAAWRGGFLLAEAQLAQKDFRSAEKTLTALGGQALSPDSEWQRQYLLARSEAADGRGEAALQRVTNLVALAVSRSNVVLQARSLALRGEILEEIDPELAARSYHQITSLPGVPSEQKRQAVLQLAELAISQEQLTNAIQQLTQFLQANPRDPSSDLIRLTLGELYLRQFQSLRDPSQSNAVPALATSTNLLQLARLSFEQVIQQFTNSTYLGKAYLNRAWCYWEEAQLYDDPTPLVECQKALRTALTRLPRSLDQARAQFKLADCFLELKDYSQALTNYLAVLEQYSDLPEAKDKLLEQAQYQVVRTAVALGQLGLAQSAVDRLLREYPNGRWSDQSLYLLGQALSNARDFNKAHQAFNDFEKRFPDSPLLPEVRLAQARSFASQADWSSAIPRLDSWIAQFTNHAAQAQAKFDQAWCYDQAGQETNALALFTKLVQEFPGSAPAALGQLWLGDHYLTQRDYTSAERSYQFLSRSTNSVSPHLTRQAQLMAAKAAFFRQGYSDARKYLLPLVEDPEVGPEAWFMLGDIELEDPSRDSTNRLAKFEEAINRFSRITNFFSSSRLAPLAMGKIANCHFQLAAQNTNRYEMATNQYYQLVLAPSADLSTRSQAEVALGQVLERMAEQRPNRLELLGAALSHYLNVVYGRRVRPGEDPDPFWMSRAALAAGTLATERLQRFEEAERLYKAMAQSVPSMREVWEARLESLRQQRPR